MTTMERHSAEPATVDDVAVAPDTARISPAEPLAVQRLPQRADLSASSLRAALRYFSTTLRGQDELIVRRRHEMSELAGELASSRAEIDALRQTLAERERDHARLAQHLAHRDAEVARLAHLLVWPLRIRRALRDPVGMTRRVLRRARQAFAAAPAEAGSPGTVAPVAAAPSPCPPPTPTDYRLRMRALLAGGLFAELRTVAVLTPPTMREAGAAIERCLAQTGLRCRVIVGLAMPETFADDLYLVVDPDAFAQLPPADRRIVWLVDPAGTAATLTDEALARHAESLAIFDASLANIQALQQRGIVLHQTFYVPLDPVAPAHMSLADDSPMGLSHLLPRALHGCGALDDDAFEQATRGTRLDAERIVLCLPEALARFDSARSSALQGAMLFPGLRQLDGWKGTALSYRYLARRALEAGSTRLIVAEDDAAFADDFEPRLARTLAYLDAHAGSWDLFSGLLTDLSAEAEVTAIEVRDGDMFLRLDSVIGMVFGIYGLRALEALAAYRLTGNDAMKDTIDRYLESLKPRCLTLFPPLVRHDDGLSSTLWKADGRSFVSNESVNPMIHRSQERLFAKVGDRLDRAEHGG